MTNYILLFLKEPATLLILGLLTHFLADMLKLKRENRKTVSLVQYWSAYPIQSSICVITALVGMVALDESQQLTGVNAYLVGYASNSLANKAGDRVRRLLDA